MLFRSGFLFDRLFFAVSVAVFVSGWIFYLPSDKEQTCNAAFGKKPVFSGGVAGQAFV